MTSTRFVAYTRVSTDAQDRSGLGEEGQRAAIDRAIVGQGELVAVFHDAASGKRHPADRPGLSAALRLLDEGEADVLIVYDLSRVSRFVLHWAELVEVTMIDHDQTWLTSVRERTDLTNARGKEIAYVDVVRAQGERDLTSERTVRALAAKRARGERLGRPSFGWRAEPGRTDFTKDPEQWPVVERMLAMHRQGESNRQIARDLDVNHKLVGRVINREA